MPELDDDKGMSVVMVNTNKGEVSFQRTGVDSYPMEYNVLLRFNPSVEKSVRLTDKRRRFYSDTKQTLGNKIDKLSRATLLARIRRRVYHILSVLLRMN